jgi:Spy/CpxP family protein refolding chaperone
MREIFKQNEERMKAYRTESRARLSELRKQLWEETNAVLTPEQKKKNDEMIRRFEEWRKKESERNPSRDRRSQDPPPPSRER